MKYAGMWNCNHESLGTVLFFFDIFVILTLVSWLDTRMFIAFIIVLSKTVGKHARNIFVFNTIIPHTNRMVEGQTLVV